MGILDKQQQTSSCDPSISGFLRAVSKHPSSLIDDQITKRYKDLDRKRKEKKRDKDKIIEKGQLTWSYFSDPNRDNDEERNNRVIYTQFKEMVLTMIDDDEVPSDEIASAVYETFMIVGNPHKEKNSKCESLRQIFRGTFKLKMYPTLYDLVQKLLLIRSPFEFDKSSAQESTSSIDSFESSEWGLQLKFNIIDELFGTGVDGKQQQQQQQQQQQHSYSNRDETIIVLPQSQNRKNQRPKNRQQQSQQQDQQEFSSGSSGSSIFNIEWLSEKCIYMSESIGLPADSLLDSIKSVLKNSKDIQDDLMNLIGLDHLDFITDIISHKSTVLLPPSSSSNKQQQQQQQPGSSFSFQSKQEKELDKVKRKEEKKKFKLVSQQGEYQDSPPEVRLVDPTTSRHFNPATIYNQTEFKNEGINTFSAVAYGNVALPEGTVRTDKSSHTEVMVPYTKSKPFLANEALVPIDPEIKPESRKAFGSIKTLNRIQSRVFETAYRTNENLLISAPTGAGKTNIAMLTILHEIESNISNGYLDKDIFKIVYIAPLKALASEMTEKFGSSLAYMGIIVKELTGDMQLTQKELKETQIIVTTPEKWDVITRKSSDVALTSLVRLIIIDEIHLLHEERGPVLESIVARTLRQVEATQQMIRIVGLSATLPNYKDVARFIRASDSGCYYFDSSYRPVPLTQNFIGVKGNSVIQNKNLMNQICYDKLERGIRDGYQVMVFVHSRKDTVKTAEALIELAKDKKFRFNKEDLPSHARREVERAKSKEVRDLFQYSVSVHHAGLLRHDRNIIEKQFAEGNVKVLVCTATLAWGVNLPAHTVIIKGTQVYDAKNGGFIDLGISDVMQIFGRAGRPQFDTSGEAFLITQNDKLDHYLMLMSSCMPIESKFLNNLEDNLNAEIVLGTVSNVNEAINWLGYTYLYIRMLANPQVYGISRSELAHDRTLSEFKRNIIIKAARKLDECKMIRFDESSENFSVIELGRIASHYYIKHPSIETFNECLSDTLLEEQIFNVLSQSSEFENINLREEELTELGQLAESSCFYETEALDRYSKVKIILQAFLSRSRIDGFSLVSDSNYVNQNASRILRGLFEITMKKGWCGVSKQILDICKMIDHQQWHFESSLRQFKVLSPDTIKKIEDLDLSPEDISEMGVSELATIVGNPQIAKNTINVARQFPRLDFDVHVQPITASIIRINLKLIPQFRWNDKAHGDAQPFWIWIEDNENQYIYHSEYFMLTKKAFSQSDSEPILINCVIPLPNPMPTQFFVHYISDRWLNSDGKVPISFRHLVIPQQNRVVNTELLDLQPLPVQALKNPEFEKLFKFSHFNPIQTQVFHTLYYTNHNVLLGSPTGSGKTICSELAMFKVFRDEPHKKVVYIAPLKALVRERMNDWSVKLQQKLGKKLVELTGDYTPNMIALQNADIVTTTPEKWDGISRNWKNRSYVTSVSLLIIDEIHLLGELRGPTLEVIVSRMKMIAAQTGSNIRIVGLSTAMANAVDLAEWMGIESVGLFNFRPSCRPVPIEVHIQGFAGKHYCPRMQTMNKPAFAAISTYSPKKPVLIFVSSRRQTRLTALDLISYLVVENDPRQWVHTDIDPILDRIKDANLKHTLSFGIGMHHAGLNDNDRSIVEKLFGENKIQILISTSTLAWGVNLPAHLVIIKGTEYFDGKTKKYVDFPLTDVLQMMGRAGRPQFDKEGKAVVMVHEPKKNFYKKFLYDPFPIESHLKDFLHDHINAEIVSGTIQDKQGGIEYLVNTFFFRRLLVSPSYYGLEDNNVDTINNYLSELLDNTLYDLEMSKCIQVNEDDTIIPLSLGKISSFYYLNYKTVQSFLNYIKPDSEIESLLKVLCNAAEYNEFPVRHNEDLLNAELNEKLPIQLGRYDDPHTKVHLLLQAHFEKCPLPISDYVTDTKSALDQGIRILQAMVDYSIEYGFFGTSIRIIRLLQMLVQGRWSKHSPFTILPHVTDSIAAFISDNLSVQTFTELLTRNGSRDAFKKTIENALNDSQVREVMDIVNHLPLMKIQEVIPPVETVQSGKPFNIKLKVTRESKKFSNGHAYAPRYSKEKDEGWVLILTNGQEEIVAMKKIPQMINQWTTLNFVIDSAPNNPSETYFVKLYSDTYLGERGMSYRQQSNLIHKLKNIEREKRIVESKLEKLDEKNSGKRLRNQYDDSNGGGGYYNKKVNIGNTYHNRDDRQQYNRQNYQRNFSNNNNNNNVAVPAPKPIIIDKSSDETTTGTSSSNESTLKKSDSTTTQKPQVSSNPENQKRNRMFLGMLNRTLTDFQKDIDKKTDADIKRTEVDNKVETIISKEQEETDEREKLKKQQIKEKEIKHHELLQKKQEELENKLLEGTWELHHKTLAKFPYKTKTQPSIFFTLSHLADKHQFTLPNYLSSTTTATSTSSSSLSIEDRKYKKLTSASEKLESRRRDNDDDSDVDDLNDIKNDNSVLDKENDKENNDEENELKNDESKQGDDSKMTGNEEDINKKEDVVEQGNSDTNNAVESDKKEETLQDNKTMDTENN
eukprot:gene4723-5897_t